MKSHTVTFTPRQLGTLVGAPLVPVVLFAAVMRFATSTGLLPPPRPMLDIDRTVLSHQARAARTAPPAEIVLIGDSSCLMNVDAAALSQALNRPVLNLGTLSYLDLHSYALLLREYSKQHRRPPAIVLLLMHPEALRRGSTEDYPAALLRDLMAGRDTCRDTTFYGRLSCALGMTAFQDRVQGRLIPTPLRSAYGRVYGFTADLDSYMEMHRGSLLEVESKPFEGNAEYRLAPALREASRVFRQTLPAATTLLVGITPVPESFAPADYSESHAKMLGEWSAWLGGGQMLRRLPATMPDDLFASVTHLNQSGVERYTTVLALLLSTNSAASMP